MSTLERSNPYRRETWSNEISGGTHSRAMSGQKEPDGLSALARTDYLPERPRACAPERVARLGVGFQRLPASRRGPYVAADACLARASFAWEPGRGPLAMARRRVRRQPESPSVTFRRASDRTSVFRCRARPWVRSPACRRSPGLPYIGSASARSHRRTPAVLRARRPEDHADIIFMRSMMLDPLVGPRRRAGRC
jgi:hypothetical protein